MSSSDEKPISNKNLYVAVVICNLSSLSCGHVFTWTSPTIVKLEMLHVVNSDQESWIGSLVAVGACFGPAIAGLLVDRIGRKRTLLLTSFLFLSSWIIIIIAFSLPKINFGLIYAARVEAGLSCGIIFTVVPMYVAEIAEDSVRGSLGTFMAFFIVAGFLLPYSIGPYTSFVTLIELSCVTPILFAVAFSLMPETPYYLISNGRTTRAITVLEWLRGTDDRTIIQKELRDIQVVLDESAMAKGGIKELLLNKGNIKALYLSCGLAGFQQLSGINVILFYSESIFRMTGTDISASLCSLTVGIVMFISAGLAPPVVKCCGIKIPLLISALGMSLFQALLSIYFFLKRAGFDMSLLKYAPILCLLLFIIVFSIGFGPLPWAVMGEVFAPNVKAKGSAITVTFCWIICFILTKCFNIVEEVFGDGVSFAIFSVCCLIAFFFTILLLPNTKGLSLNEIQDLLNGLPVTKV